ncbi:MarR family winged helix-turn-helix transcriptional regulator [Phyllobacterium myrsinacearum]|uniref:MarR family transcriptional regulator for hemolysin n=1 Tax=Phyllobacterium myrsinacearum TaxID=28101 RepID=A0A839EM24_9HYPH|nr:MarR family winged helix-turn-helix transcriptional regulator [Phyllobacterium myrsinacearum]MBA8878516.1 MarR family transcriptional regulator for hemolysin [Phyllobacterium myrsinacearum]
MGIAHTPIGLLVTRTAKTVARTFDDALAAEGGSISVWLVLLALVRGGHRMQSELADEVGIQGPTLTHHLNGMEDAGLLVRKRAPDNRRIHLVELTETGRTMFHRLRNVALAYDARLRADVTEDEMNVLRSLLERLAVNAVRQDVQKKAD